MMKYDTRLLCKQQIRAGLSYSFEPYRLQARVNCYEENGLQKQRFRIRINHFRVSNLLLRVWLTSNGHLPRVVDTFIHTFV